MNERRVELKVGAFVVAGLALLALLVLSFSRGNTLFNSTYRLRILLPSAAGLKPSADVMMSGVPIGRASGLELLPDGRSVAVNVSVLSKYKVRTNAVFHIDALGFLGDQYVEVTPSLDTNAGYLQDGDTVEGESPFNMQEAVRSVSGLLEQAKKTVTDIDRAITNANHTVLSTRTLTSFGLTISNLETMTEGAARVVQGAEDLVHSNTASVNAAVANLRTFSEKLNSTADDLDRLVATNRAALDQTVQNLRDFSASAKQVAADLQAGKGLAGGLLKDDEMKAHLAALVSNANTMAATFATFGSNLNQKGIWSMLWKPKNPERRKDPARKDAGAPPSP
jgi:phospholipid/cholesterol/gamma-HCH transport system substrate-binding protein